MFSAIWAVANPDCWICSPSRTYRDVQLHACRHHPNIYRQIAAGTGVVAITDRRESKLPSGYEILGQTPVIRDIMRYPRFVADNS